MHLMASVVRALNNLGTEVEHLPGGCTAAVQPVDNGINKPMKDRARASYHDHQIQSFEEHGKITAPTRLQIVQWI